MDDLLLDARHVFGGHLDAEIAARHHQRVRELDDLVEPGDRRRFFELDHQPGGVADQLSPLGDILGALHEGERDPVGAVLQREGEIGAVLFGDRRDRQHHVRHVDPLVVRQGAADEDFGVGEIGAAIGDPEAQLAVVEQEFGAGVQRREHFGMRQRGAVAIARPLGEVEAELVAGRKADFAAGEIAEPQLWPLHIGEDADRRPVSLSTRRIAANRARWSSCVPWLKLRRKTSTPASNRARIRASLELAGPRVATILALR